MRVASQVETLMSHRQISEDEDAAAEALVPKSLKRFVRHF
jgi:hypothetical protein